MLAPGLILIKIGALVMALVMVLTMGTVAFAADGTNNTNDVRKS